MVVFSQNGCPESISEFVDIKSGGASASQVDTSCPYLPSLIAQRRPVPGSYRSLEAGHTRETLAIEWFPR
jgi:hypothetical protein